MMIVSLMVVVTMATSFTEGQTLTQNRLVSEIDRAETSPAGVRVKRNGSRMRIQGVIPSVKELETSPLGGRAKRHSGRCGCDAYKSGQCAKCNAGCWTNNNVGVRSCRGNINGSP